MTFLSRPADRRINWSPIIGLPDVWCATLETAYRAETGLSTILHCVRPDEDKVSIRIHLRFGKVLAYWTTEHLVDPWQEDGPAYRPLPNSPRFSPPFQEVYPSTWVASLAPPILPATGDPNWRHFEIVSSDAIFHVISTGKLEAASYIKV
ncbi:MAG: hypothetical protein IPK89_00430 [Sphingomonadales bacterium]|nr:hypothetical protein [Sphingomonadales bacterium]